MADLAAAAAAIAAHHGVPPDQVRPVPGGMDNHAFTLGEHLFLRIAQPGSEDQLRRETLVIGPARAAGVRTPAIIAYDDSLRLTCTPYLVQERVPGTDLAAAESPAAPHLLRDLGRDLARLHSLAPVAGLHVEVGGDPVDLVDAMATVGYLDSDTARWLTRWFAHLDELRPPEGVAVLHGDVAPQNVLSGADGGYAALVDWGDTHLGDPAGDFAKLPLSEVVEALAGYAELAPEAPVSATAVLRVHLHWALARLRDPTPQPGRRHWTAPPASRVLGLLRFLSDPPAAWSHLVPTRLPRP
ncbi:aminoglycoside phosphotransferase family protein [Catellatospora sp. KI3]|uniref:phosphotransferase family protein n=1 Tax=Catellatospora sp. KI3 TaxID=3041620 RepID=UPI00248326A1|nr:aminoglycoside phosphotransferase family protein [Catellatospora sp. KI3]MDI1464751.1 aminoglycoside phosphotransferase family protein [Catellatospora sp. KI3]